MSANNAVEHDALRASLARAFHRGRYTAHMWTRAMGAIDWQLALDFVKALAGPIATLTAALIAAKFALRIFLGQKAIERRLEWFGRLHQQMDVLTTWAVHIRSLMEIDNPDALGKAKQQFLAASEQLRATCDEGDLYASKDIFHTIQRLRAAIVRFHHAQTATP